MPSKLIPVLMVIVTLLQILMVKGTNEIKINQQEDYTYLEAMFRNHGVLSTKPILAIIVTYLKGSNLRTFEHDSVISPITLVSLSPNARFTATGHQHPFPTIRIWNLTTGRCVRTFWYAHTESITAMRFAWDNDFLVSCSADRTVKLWPNTPVPRWYHWCPCLSLGKPRVKPIDGLFITTTNTRLITVARTGTFELWAIPTRPQCLRTFRINGTVTKCDLAADDTRLVAVGPSASMLGHSLLTVITLWGLQIEAREIKCVVFPRFEEWTCCCFFPHKDSIVVGTTAGRLLVWDLRASSWWLPQLLSDVHHRPVRECGHILFQGQVVLLSGSQLGKDNRMWYAPDGHNICPYTIQEDLQAPDVNTDEYMFCSTRGICVLSSYRDALVKHNILALSATAIRPPSVLSLKKVLLRGCIIFAMYILIFYRRTKFFKLVWSLLWKKLVQS